MNEKQVIEIARLYHMIKEKIEIYNTATEFEGPNGIAASNNAYKNLRENLIPEFMKFPKKIRDKLIAPSVLEKFLK